MISENYAFDKEVTTLSEFLYDKVFGINQCRSASSARVIANLCRYYVFEWWSPACIRQSRAWNLPISTKKSIKSPFSCAFRDLWKINAKTHNFLLTLHKNRWWPYVYRNWNFVYHFLLSGKKRDKLWIIISRFVLLCIPHVNFQFL